MGQREKRTQHRKENGSKIRGRDGRESEVSFQETQSAGMRVMPWQAGGVGGEGFFL